MFKQIIKKDPDFSPTESVEFDRLLVISLGTGSNKSEKKYNAQMASKWGAISWVYNGGHTPLIDCYSDASKDMVDFHSSVVFQAFNSEKNYLRIDVSDQYYLSVFFFLDISVLLYLLKKVTNTCDTIESCTCWSKQSMGYYTLIEKSFYILIYIIEVELFFFSVFKG